MQVNRIAHTAVKATPETRLATAKANDNGGLWWVCLSPHTIAKLEHRFKEGSVARILYDTVGGMLGDPAMKHSNNRQYAYIQIARRDGYVDTALADLGIELVSVIPASKITNP